MAEFLEVLKTLDRNPVHEARRLFDPAGEVVVARAPGRLDVMGGIADYSGSLVLQMPIREATFVALQRDPSPVIRAVSLDAEANHRAAAFDLSLADLAPGGRLADYAAARAAFQRDPAQCWGAYVAGVFLVLIRERGAGFAQGARILIRSNVPEGKGVSSSAALEVAVMQAVAGAFGIALDPRELALLCQKVENLVVGAPCGVMDQMTAACGQAGHLLALLCQPAELQGTIPVPDEIGIWGLDSGVRHSVAGEDYSSVRVGAFMGYRMIVERAGRAVDPVWRGYLANLAPSEFERLHAPGLPERIGGADFLARYQGTTDPVTRVQPDRVYLVRVPTAHPVHENFRVRVFAGLLGADPTADRLELLGELMYQSHASYSACGLGSAGTDRLVDLVRSAGPERGLYGAKITGGGSGGTVAVLGRRVAAAAVSAIADQYARETGHHPFLFTGSSAGAARFGLLKECLGSG